MTVWSCMRMLGNYEKIRIYDKEKELTAEPFSVYDFERNSDKFPREIFDILDNTATSIDLVRMIIYCEV